MWFGGCEILHICHGQTTTTGRDFAHCILLLRFRFISDAEVNSLSIVNRSNVCRYKLILMISGKISLFRAINFNITDVPQKSVLLCIVDFNGGLYQDRFL